METSATVSTIPIKINKEEKKKERKKEKDSFLATFIHYVVTVKSCLHHLLVFAGGYTMSKVCT